MENHQNEIKKTNDFHNVKSSVSELLSHWRIQESLFQGYRRIFLTLETVLLSIAALGVSTNISSSSALIVLLSLSIVGAWTAVTFIPIISRRIELVFFWQAKILKAERGIPIYTPLKEMKDFQDDSNHFFRKDPDFTELCKGKHVVRSKLIIGLPVIILIAWLGLALAFYVK